MGLNVTVHGSEQLQKIFRYVQNNYGLSKKITVIHIDCITIYIICNNTMNNILVAMHSLLI